MAKSNNEQFYDKARGGKIKEVQSQLSTDPGLDRKWKNHSESDWTALHVATRGGHTNIVEVLINAGWSTEEIDKFGCTPIHLASENGRTELIRILINSHCNINAMDENGKSALHLMINVETAKVLLTNKASVGLLDNMGCSALHYAHNVEVARVLIEAGSKIDCVDKEGNTCLHFSSRKGDIEQIFLLLSEGLSIDTMNDNGVTPLGILQTSLKDDRVEVGGQYYSGINHLRNNCLQMLKTQSPMNIPEQSTTCNVTSTSQQGHYAKVVNDFSKADHAANVEQVISNTPISNCESSNGSSSSYHIPKLEVSSLCNELANLVCWEKFGRKLPGINQTDIDTIKLEENRIEEMKAKLFDKWLRTDVNASWKTVLTALEKIDERALAKALRRKLCVNAPLLNSAFIDSYSGNHQTEPPQSNKNYIVLAIVLCLIAVLLSSVSWAYVYGMQ